MHTSVLSRRLLLLLVFICALGLAGLRAQKAPPLSASVPTESAAKLALPLREARLADATVRPYQVTLADTAAYLRLLDSLVYHYQVRVLFRHPESRTLFVEATPDLLLRYLLPHPAVIFIDRGDRVPIDETPANGNDLTVNRINAVHHLYPHLTGAGLTASIREQAFDVTDVDFRGRYGFTPLTSTVTTQHATFVATLLGGAGNTHRTGRGAAWQSRLTSADYTTLLPDADSYYSDYAISVQNHSYGVGLEAYYGAEAGAYDALVKRRPTLLHVFSAGNSGTSADTFGVYAGLSGWANLTGSFKMAKNVLTVGHVDTAGRVSPFSSRGPAYDGRIKPDLVAYGRDGSSGATALVSGVSLLLQQAYSGRHDGQLPPAAFLRALLLNTTDDLLTPGPDYSSGFGNLNALRAVEAMLSDQWLLDSLDRSSIRTYSLQVPPGLQSLRLTLAWTDPAAAPNAPTALVNDLDLELYNAATGDVSRPWVLRTTASSDSLAAPATKGTDRLNNVEQITLERPAAGEYEIRVHAHALQTATQPFALSWRFDTAGTFRWTYPAPGEAMTAGEQTALRWMTTLPAGKASARIDISYDNGQDWIPLAAGVDPSRGLLQWRPPDTTATARLRLTTEDVSFLSEAFVLAPEPRLQVGFNCGDSVLVYWSPLPGAAAYLVEELGDRYLEPLKSTPDTTIVLTGPGSANRYVAVRALTEDGRKGPRSYLLQPAGALTGCYLTRLLADYFPDAGRVELLLEIGTTYGLVAVTLEKWRDGSFAPLRRWDTPDDLSYSYSDPDLQPGRNRYRARFDLPGGGVVVTEPVDVFALTDAPLLVFPNPVRAGEAVQALLDFPDEDVYFELFDARGRRIMERLMEDYPEAVELHPGLASGLYFYRVRTESGQVAAGQLVVE